MDLDLRRKISWIIFALGSIMLASSLIYQSSIPAFIGLGLIFWGAILLYTGNEKFVGKSVLISSIVPSLADLNQMLNELKYEGEGIYLPPKYLTDLEASKVFIGKKGQTKLPLPEEIQLQEDKILLEEPAALLIRPPGLFLSKLFEETLGISFSKVNLRYLQQNLSSLLIEDLEIAENLEISLITESKNPSFHKKPSYDRVEVKITSSIYSKLSKDVIELTHSIKAIGDPISSAIACAITIATGKPLVIDRIEVNGKTIEVDFRLLEIVEDEIKKDVTPLLVRTLTPTPNHLSVARFPASFLSNPASLISLILGSGLLVLVGWLIWHDLTLWGKSLIQILFGSRDLELISLGIGLRVIHYLLVGTALLLQGLFLHLRKTRGKL
jgi:hypothetical protein